MSKFIFCGTAEPGSELEKAISKGFEKMSAEEKAELFEKTREQVSMYTCIDYSLDWLEN